MRAWVLRSMSERRRIQTTGQGPESSHSFKECVTAHWSSDGAWIIIGHKRPAEAVGSRKGSVGEHSSVAEGRGTTPSGDAGKANVGMSNDKEGEKPSRRKTKDS